LFGRLGLSSRISGQLELSKIDSGSQGTFHNGTALLTVDLGAGQLMPMILAGGGIDRGSDFAGATAAHHIEGGLGLEYRASSGFTIGADARIGGRWIDSEPARILPAVAKAPFCPVDGCVWTSGGIQAGEYRAVGLYAGIRF
jgi:hypothetical protein